MNKFEYVYGAGLGPCTVGAAGARALYGGVGLGPYTVGAAGARALYGGRVGLGPCTGTDRHIRLKTLP